MSDWNAGIITEFRENAGNVGGVFDGKPLLLLNHLGAKTGLERVSPLMYQSVDGGYAVFASKAGAHTHPDWMYNLQANPEVTVEVGTATVPVTAREATSEEREPIWVKQKADYPQFAEYEASTERVIPVFILEPRS
ncbi:MAG: nitroreductase family deazaflavin-dependent oxidoreductase [Acidimicrobiia bacterium]